MTTVKIVCTELPKVGEMTQVKIDLEVPEGTPKDSPALDVAYEMLAVFQAQLEPLQPTGIPMPGNTTLN